jgi:type IX secretion system PorP/SprF family membrane protein
MTFKLLKLFRDLLCTGWIFLTALGGASGQDAIFSQFTFSGPMLNPALTGETGENRAILHYRNQWPGIPGGITHAAFGMDRSLPLVNSGIGVHVLQTTAGVGGLRSTTVSLDYSYKLAISRTWTARAGAQVGYGLRSINFFSLTFPDQLGPDGPLGLLTNERFTNDGNRGFLDLGLGGALFQKAFWMGFSVAHLNRPDQSFFDNATERLPRRILLHGGYKWNLQKKRGLLSAVQERSFSPQFVFRKQGPFTQLDVGAIASLEPFWAGVFYRGIPFLKRYGVFNHDALVFMAGLKQASYTFGYSFDATVSLLGLPSGGAHELTLLYNFSFVKQGKTRKVRRKTTTTPTYPGV